ncbi:MAG: T9SS type A sorting domain-containing protein [Hymenobacteraceae bacterium]|nr:T9SS type A sorting domain-containing protein [Hymenobacteraceae bacterium]
MRSASTICRALTLGLLLASGPLAAQGVTNNGALITTTPGTLFTVTGGGYQQAAGSTLRTDGTTRVTGNVQGAAGSTLNLGVGELEVSGDVTNLGTTTATSTGTLRLTGAANQTVDVSGGTVGRLIVNKPTAAADTVRVPSDLNVIGQVQLLDGMVRTRVASAIVLPDGATVTGEATGQYVQGNLTVTRAAVSGAAPVDFQNGAVINPQGNTLGDVTVKRAAGLQVLDVTYGQNPNKPTFKGVDRIWTITPQAQPVVGQPAALTMTWLPDDDNGLTMADLMNAAAWRRAGVGAPWEQISAYQDATARTLTVAADTLAQWTVASQNKPLPVELLAFAAARAGNAARLTWTTASEQNSAWFEVEVSANGRDFRAIGRVAAQGNTAQRHDYALTDPQLLTYRADPVYYRLRQIDRDGRAALSAARALRVAGFAAFSAVAWPNPFDGATGVQLHVSSSVDTPLELTLSDAVGRQIQRRTVAGMPGTTTILLPETTSLATGVYLLRVRQGTNQATLRLTRQ